MGKYRFFLPEKLKREGPLCLTEPELVHRLYRVLRLQAGNEVTLCDNSGSEARAEIKELGPDRAVFDISSIEAGFIPLRSVSLAVGIIKRDKFEWLVEKGTELGVSRFVPLLTDRAEKKGLRLERLNKIAREAAEQCGRSDLPQIEDPCQMQEVLENDISSGSCMVLDPSVGISFSSRSLSAGQTVTCLLGPEGGWSSREREIFRSRQVESVAWSGLTLKTETAAVIAAGFLLLDKQDPR